MIRFADRVSVGDIKETAEGYLVATARVARTGVQQYLASELGDVAAAAGFKPNDVVRVLRSEKEVFDEASLRTITRLPVTIDHPKEHVTADNWSKLSVGEVGDAYATEPEWIVVNPMIKDAAATKAAKTTHKQISMGYTANIVEYGDKAIADFEQKTIRYNHLALVQKGRAGDMARIADSWGVCPVEDYDPGNSPSTRKGVSDMELKPVVLGDAAAQVAVGDIAAVEAYKVAMTKKLADAEAAKKAAEDKKDEEIGELKAKLKKAEDAAIVDVDALVAARSALVAQVKAVDAAIEVAGKSDAELRKLAVKSKLGDAAIADASDAEISGMFKVLAAGAGKSNPVADAISIGVKTVGDQAAAMQDSWQKANADMNAWRNQQGGAN